MTDPCSLPPSFRAVVGQWRSVQALGFGKCRGLAPSQLLGCPPPRGRQKGPVRSCLATPRGQTTAGRWGGDCSVRHNDTVGGLPFLRVEPGNPTSPPLTSPPEGKHVLRMPTDHRVQHPPPPGGGGQRPAVVCSPPWRGASAAWMPCGGGQLVGGTPEDGADRAGGGGGGPLLRYDGGGRWQPSPWL